MLVGRAQAGDSGAFGTLVKRYESRMYAVTYRILGNADQAADVVQEAFTRAFEAIGRFTGAASFYTWLYRIAVNTSLSVLRKGGRTHEMASEDLELAAGESHPRPVSEADEDPVTRIMASERIELVQRAIRSLSPMYRTLVVLRDLEGLDYEEISKVASIPAGTVKSRLHRARLELKQKLKDVI
jgi:RNA polymerase sigma-70 factor (ECF subfamily)